MKQLSLKFDQKLKRYYARIQIGGVRRRFWFGSSEKKSARDLAEKVKAIAAGKEVFTTVVSTAVVDGTGRKDMRLEELAHLHLEWTRANRSARSYTLRSYAINALLKFMGPSMVGDITRLKLSQFYDYARAKHSRRNNGGNHYYREVKTMLLWAEEYELCDLPVKHFPPMQHTPPRTLRFTDEEIAKLLACIPECDFRDMLLFGLMTGLRPHEMRTLKKSEIMDDGHGHSYVLIEVHKTSRSARDPRPRTVPLTKEACAIIKRQGASFPKSEFVFLNEAGTPYDSAGFRHKLERWCRRAKIDKKPPYALRHTFASMQADGDINMCALSELMGHSSTRTTARYIRVSSEHHLRAVEKGAEHILSLMNKGAEVADTESEGSQKVAAKVATNPNSEKETGGCITATACESTTKNGRGGEI